jgi:hypothetical protein
VTVFELQVRKSAAVAAIRDEINHRRLPFPTFPELFVLANPSLQGASLQRIECVGCSIEPSSGEGPIVVETQLVFHHNTLPEARAAGSLQPPIPHQFPSAVSIEVSVTSVQSPAQPGQPPPPAQTALQWSLPFGFLPGNTPLTLSAGGLPDSGVVAAGGIEASEEIVSLRLGTVPGDPVRGHVEDKLGAEEWSFSVPGSVFADAAVASLAAALHDSLPGNVVVSRAPSGSWYPGGLNYFPGAVASATVHVQHECVFGIVIPIDLTLRMLLQPNGHSLDLTVSLSWKVDSALCDFVAGGLLFPILPLIIDKVIGDAVSKKLLDAGIGPGHGFKEVDHNDTSITFKGSMFLPTPSSRLALTKSEVNVDGLRIAGTTRLQPPPLGLQGEVTLPHSGLDVDCSHRSVHVKFFGPQVALRDIGIAGGVPRLFPGRVWFIPPGAWKVTPGSSNTWLDLALELADPPEGRLPVGTATSVFLHTDCGLRWADLGVIPPDHPAPTTQDIAGMISQCMAISDPWGAGRLNLGWLIDPPDRDLGLDAVRQWSLGFRELPDGARLEFLALDPSGSERLLGAVEGRQSVAVELATDADETLQVRATEALSAPAPIVSQRWVIPITAIPLGEDVPTVASSGDVIVVRDGRGEIRVIDAGPDGRSRVRVAERSAQADPAWPQLLDALDLEERRGVGAWATASRISEGMLAVVHRGNLLIGGVGPATRL